MEYSPVSPVTASGDENYVGQGQVGSGGAAKLGRREGMLSTTNGLHGADEAIRRTVNGTIARCVGDKAELERAKVVKEQGIE